jgi:hypothetical protein
MVSFKGKTLIMYTVKGTKLNNQNEHVYNTFVTPSLTLSFQATNILQTYVIMHAYIYTCKYTIQ